MLEIAVYVGFVEAKSPVHDLFAFVKVDDIKIFMAFHVELKQIAKIPRFAYVGTLMAVIAWPHRCSND